MSPKLLLKRPKTTEADVLTWLPRSEATFDSIQVKKNSITLPIDRNRTIYLLIRNRYADRAIVTVNQVLVFSHETSYPMIAYDPAAGVQRPRRK
ncbi:hypothetical protein EVAR_84108_1 [Eumeta japonica]|uniref:Uncharacterized protein n=1 Tax=Eumeta variegata TaxID=151549 RepID=A0A4C1V0D4_EUMVA|nr:hypothetical protein EVAR_84108_1 [Eumeta japonica]